MENGKEYFYNLTARNGHTALQLSLYADGFAADSPLVIRAAARNLLLDDRLYQALPGGVPTKILPPWLLMSRRKARQVAAHPTSAGKKRELRIGQLGGRPS